ncbi:hypothetical protein [Iodobacter fluviatilis]|uniref:Uncharacterized protein n=1 Tax=Iodobacter fluviatilis TaxID=537 RepID=A0A7G3GFN8_9NEIS|nr:hypothetical protein [Iodobacter fluviatilis]QBC45873.1 hypothetical protein C1H71_20230 [Iodobacter fluviatilis]
MKTVDMLSRDEKLALIFKHTHHDYKSHTDGVKAILVCRGATAIVPMEQLTDAEIAARIDYAVNKENKLKRR